jgi:hypothetical protein
LNEYGREVSELWDEGHIRLIHTWLEANNSDNIIEPAIMGQCLEL